MPWTETTRPHYQRAGLRYASDLTDTEWALIEPFLPRRRRMGRRRSTDLRVVVEALFYIVSMGCQWRQLPREFPPYSTVQGYFYAWVRDGRWQVIKPCPGDGIAREGRTGGEPERRRDRQPVGQDHRKWWSRGL